jgi:hypothetical protein
LQEWKVAVARLEVMEIPGKDKGNKHSRYAPIIHVVSYSSIVAPIGSAGAW